MLGKYLGEMSFVFPFLPNLSTLGLFSDPSLFGIDVSVPIPQNWETTKGRIREHLLFYRYATNVLFVPEHINQAFFYCYDRVKGVAADF